MKNISYLKLNNVLCVQCYNILQDLYNHITYPKNKFYIHLNLLEVMVIYVHYHG